MKKSKAIKLVLVTGLLGAGSSIIAKPINSPAYSGKRFSAPVNYLKYASVQDSSRHSSGSSSFVQHPNVHRGGWGIFGHHASS